MTYFAITNFCKTEPRNTCAWLISVDFDLVPSASKDFKNLMSTRLFHVSIRVVHERVHIFK